MVALAGGKSSGSGKEPAAELAGLLVSYSEVRGESTQVWLRLQRGL
jgi:hypothetical protein